MADDRSRDDFDETSDNELDTAALLDQGERLLAQSARLLRRLDAALHDRGVDTTGEDEPNSP